MAAVLAAILLVVSTALAIWWTAREDSRPRSDAIVVLGSAQYNGKPSAIFAARLEHARAAPGDDGAGGTLCSPARPYEPTRSAPRAARPASSRATGTRNGEHDT